jgi:toxin ParE1/3/4
MKRFLLAPDARRDIDLILSMSLQDFGEDAADRYERLIVQAITDVAADPYRAGSNLVDDAKMITRSYHLRHSRSRADKRGHRVKKPCHFLVYRIADEITIEIVRILHDRMDIAESLPDPS